MRRLNIAWAIVLFLVLCAGGVLAAGTAPTASNAAPALETAVFSVPKLMEGTLLKDLAKALAAQDGVQAAQADAEKGTFNVTFEPKKTNPDTILKTVVSVAKDARLVSVAPAGVKVSRDGCGKCPSAKSCPGAKK